MFALSSPSLEDRELRMEPVTCTKRRMIWLPIKNRQDWRVRRERTTTFCSLFKPVSTHGSCVFVEMGIGTAVSKCSGSGKSHRWATKLCEFGSLLPIDITAAFIVNEGPGFARNEKLK